MSENKGKETVNEIVEQGKDLLSKANSRHIVIRNDRGEKVVDVTFTVAAVIAVLLLWWIPLGLPLIVIGLVYGLYAKLKLEIVRELGNGDTVVDVQLPKDGE
jgi:Domain of unknown function (DUF4342)